MQTEFWMGLVAIGVLTAVVSTQLLAHVYLGGGLCELPSGREDEVRT